MHNLAFTGERIIPKITPEVLFREHESRYQFAATFAKQKLAVDVACGVGIGSQHLLDAGARCCIGVDIDVHALDYARTEYRDCHFAACDALALCLPDNGADLFVSFETIEHISDAAGFLRECRRVLKPGGMLICSTPNHAVYRWYGHNPFHVREFLPDEFLRLVGAVFTDLKAYSQKEVIYPTFVARRLTRRLLEWMGLRSVIQSLPGYGPSPTCAATRFACNAQDMAGEIKRYVAAWAVQPTYVIVSARKPA